MNDRRFPLPVSHARAPRVVPLGAALLTGALLFAAGFAAAVYTVGLILTSR
jgi:hypothetical protein